MGATFAQLNDRARRLIGDATTLFTDLQIDEWINDAIRDISLHFPRVIVSTLSTTLNDREYDLELSFIAPLSVEYPTGEDPKEYLLRRSRLHKDFWSQDGYYDILLTQTSDDTNDIQFIMSEKPPADETVTIWHTAVHNELSGASDETTIQDRHLHLISLFVRWKAWQELATSEGMDPDPIKLLSATQEVNAGRAERSYRAALREAKASESESAIVTGWSPDRFDRVY